MMLQFAPTYLAVPAGPAGPVSPCGPRGPGALIRSCTPSLKSHMRSVWFVTRLELTDWGARSAVWMVPSLIWAPVIMRAGDGAAAGRDGEDGGSTENGTGTAVGQAKLHEGPLEGRWNG